MTWLAINNPGNFLVAVGTGIAWFLAILTWSGPTFGKERENAIQLERERILSEIRLNEAKIGYYGRMP